MYTTNIIHVSWMCPPIHVWIRNVHDKWTAWLNFSNGWNLASPLDRTSLGPAGSDRFIGRGRLSYRCYLYFYNISSYYGCNNQELRRLAADNAKFLNTKWRLAWIRARLSSASKLLKAHTHTGDELCIFCRNGFPVKAFKCRLDLDSRQALRAIHTISTARINQNSPQLYTEIRLMELFENSNTTWIQKSNRILRSITIRFKSKLEYSYTRIIKVQSRTA